MGSCSAFVTPVSLGWQCDGKLGEGVGVWYVWWGGVYPPSSHVRVCRAAAAAAAASRRRPLSSMRRTIVGPTLIMYLSGPAATPVRCTYPVRRPVASAVRGFFRPVWPPAPPAVL